MQPSTVGTSTKTSGGMTLSSSHKLPSNRELAFPPSGIHAILNMLCRRRYAVCHSITDRSRMVLPWEEEEKKFLSLLPLWRLSGQRYHSLEDGPRQRGGAIPLIAANNFNSVQTFPVDIVEMEVPAAFLTNNQLVTGHRTTFRVLSKENLQLGLHMNRR